MFCIVCKSFIPKKTNDRHFLPNEYSFENGRQSVEEPTAPTASSSVNCRKVQDQHYLFLFVTFYATLKNHHLYSDF